MNTVTITCAETGMPISTGISVFNWVNLRYNYNYKYQNNIVELCPHCGKKHAWQMEDVYLEEMD